MIITHKLINLPQQINKNKMNLKLIMIITDKKISFLKIRKKDFRDQMMNLE